MSNIDVGDLPLKLAIIVVAYNSNSVLPACLLALDRAVSCLPDTAGRPRLLLVDNCPNHSVDDAIVSTTTEMTVLTPGANLGFAVAVNLAFDRLRDSDYILLLNPDTRLEPTALAALLTAAKARSAALVGPVLVGPNGEPHGVSERPFHSLAREAAHQLIPVRHRRPYSNQAYSTGRADCLTGACLLVDAAFLTTTGGLDTQIRMYLEDVTLCRQAHEQGLPVILEPLARCEHALGGSADGESFSTSLLLHLTLLAARIEFVRRHSRWYGGGAMRILIAIGAAMRCLLTTGQMRARHIAVARWALRSGRAPAWPLAPGT